jgi:glycerol uptake facilitator-like aquaporin
MISRRKIAMVVAEFLGTGLLTLVILAVSKSNVGIPYFIAIAAGLVAVMATMTLGGLSGSHMNPAVTIGLWSIRRINWLPAVAYIAAQMLGAIVAYKAFTYFTGSTQPWDNASSEYIGRILVAEALGAFILALGWAAAVYERMSEAKSAAVIGISLMLGIIVAAIAGGGIINPAVALASQEWVWSTFVLGPVLGAIIGFNVYSLLFAPVRELALSTAESEATADAPSVQPAAKKSAKK